MDYSSVQQKAVTVAPSFLTPKPELFLLNLPSGLSRWAVMQQHAWRRMLNPATRQSCHELILAGESLSAGASDLSHEDHRNLSLGFKY